MAKITTDFLGTETEAVTKTRLTDILTAWQFDPSAYTTWGDSRTDMNTLLTGSSVGAIAASERAGDFLPKINFLNDPRNAALDAFTGGVEGFALDFTDDTTVFSDTGGTTPAVAGDSVARVNDVSGNGLNSTQANAALRGKRGKAPKVVRNLLVNTATLSTQSRTVTAVSHTLSFKGAGTVTLSGVSTAGPLVGTGASDRVSLTFTPSAGTLTLTVSGAVTEAQLEIGALSDYQAVGASNLDVTESGVQSFGFYRHDLSDDVLPLTVPAIDGDILIAGKNGTWIEPAAPSAGAFSIGPTTYTGGTSGILSTVGDITGVELIDKTLSDSERQRIIRYYQGRGAKGLLVAGSGLDFSEPFNSALSGWTGFNATGAVGAGELTVELDAGQSSGGIYKVFSAVAQVPHFVSVLGRKGTADTAQMRVYDSNNLSGTQTIESTASDVMDPLRAIIIPTNNYFTVYLRTGGSGGETSVFDDLVVQELRPEEDW